MIGEEKPAGDSKRCKVTKWSFQNSFLNVCTYPAEAPVQFSNLAKDELSEFALNCRSRFLVHHFDAASKGNHPCNHCWWYRSSELSFLADPLPENWSKPVLRVIFSPSAFATVDLWQNLMAELWTGKSCQRFRRWRFSAVHWQTSYKPPFRWILKEYMQGRTSQSLCIVAKVWSSAPCIGSLWPFNLQHGTQLHTLATIAIATESTDMYMHRHTYILHNEHFWPSGIIRSCVFVSLLYVFDQKTLEQTNCRPWRWGMGSGSLVDDVLSAFERMPDWQTVCDFRTSKRSFLRCLLPNDSFVLILRQTLALLNRTDECEHNSNRETYLLPTFIKIWSNDVLSRTSNSRPSPAHCRLLANLSFFWTALCARFVVYVWHSSLAAFVCTAHSSQVVFLNSSYSIHSRLRWFYSRIISSLKCTRVFLDSCNIRTVSQEYVSGLMGTEREWTADSWSQST